MLCLCKCIWVIFRFRTPAGSSESLSSSFLFFLMASSTSAFWTSSSLLGISTHTPLSNRNDLKLHFPPLLGWCSHLWFPSWVVVQFFKMLWLVDIFWQLDWTGGPKYLPDICNRFWFLCLVLLICTAPIQNHYLFCAWYSHVKIRKSISNLFEMITLLLDFTLSYPGNSDWAPRVVNSVYNILGILIIRIPFEWWRS